jgi:hypothetical protein
MSKTIEISDALYEEIADQLCADNATDISALSDFVGKKLFIRTVTYHLVGKVKAVNGTLIELADASWVADSGRFMQAIKEGKLNEVEPVGQCWVNAGAITDMFPWAHSLPATQK